LITLQQFIAGVNAIIDSKPTYKLGQDGSNGLCDCIGLIIGAIRRAGGTWSGTHGSNYAARNEMQTLESPPRLEVGAAVYKYHEPGQAGWNLPAAYANHPDQNDYYHVGTVLYVNPLRIAHCTSWSGGSGIKIDTVIGKWRRGGRLKKVDYADAPEPPQEGVDKVIGYINLPATSNVFHRISPSNGSQWYGRINGGEAVEIVSSSGEWTRVRYGGKDGYVMSKFITTNPTDQPDPMPPDVVDVDKSALLTELEGLNKRQSVIIAALRGVV
jgi:hypothetical protein